MNLVDIILAFYPTAVVMRDFSVTDAGQGQFISYWNTSALGLQPSTVYLESLWPQVQISLAKASQSALADAAYQATITSSISYTTVAGVTSTYQADAIAVANLQASLAGCAKAQATPTGFFWVALDNSQAAFAYADLQGLAAAIFERGAGAFAHLQTVKGLIRAATTLDAITAIIF